MKKFFVLVLSFVSLATVLNAARTTNRRPSSSRGGNTSSVRTYPLPTQDECNVDIDYCFNRYCFDKKTLSEGVYSKCGAEPASQILINVESCLETRAVIKELDLKNGCKNYSYNRVVNLLANKDVIETGLKKNSKECQKATRALQAAKECYALMISSDGSYSLDLYERLDKLCGFEVSGDSYMLNRFFEAGDYGQANLQAISDLEMTGQNTVKRENWRQVVDATLAGYTEIAELACGEEDYKLTKVNDYALDSRDNSAMIALKAQATEIGKQTANRIVNSWFRETDCVNAPLPVGGLYWDYEKGRSPDCKIVCKEGYAIGKNSSECVKVETTTSSSVAFMGFNIGNDFVGQNTLKKAEPVQQVIVSSSSGSGSSSYVPPVGSSTCSKSTTPKGVWYLGSKGKKAVCDVFCPNAPSMRYYERNTDTSQEFFCIGDSAGRYHSWYDMTLAELNGLFKTNYSRMGNGYSEQMSAHIKNYCAASCGNNNSSSPVAGSTTSTPAPAPTEPPCESSDRSEWTTYLYRIKASDDIQNFSKGVLEISRLKEKYCEEEPEVEEKPVSTAFCDKVKNLSNTITFYSPERNTWKDVMKDYTGDCRNSIPKYAYDDTVWNTQMKREGAINMKLSKDCLCGITTFTNNENDYCSDVKKLSGSIGRPLDQTEWLGFLRKYEDTSCDVSDITYLANHYNEFFWGGKDVITSFKNCVCKKNKTYSELVEKYCKKVFPDREANYDEYKFDFCQKYIAPAYCPESLTPSKWEKCLEVLLESLPDSPTKCVYENYFSEWCFWSSNYDCNTKNGNRCKVVDGERVFDGYVIPKSTIKSSLPFRDFGDPTNMWVR